MRSLVMGCFLGAAACAAPTEEKVAVPDCAGSTCGQQRPVDPLPACRTGNCGDERFRHAVPTNDTVGIRFGARRGTSGALSAVSPVYADVDAYVEEVNDTIDDLFTGIEEVAGTSPERETETEIQWRYPDGELDGVLIINTGDYRTYGVAYALGEPGFEPDAASVVLFGEVVLDEGLDKEAFGFDLDLDRWTDAEPDVDSSGLIHISAAPFAGGIWEIWYDFEDVSEGGSAPEDSLTTVWVFDAESAALEYLGGTSEVEADVYVRWDAEGGRYDHWARYYDGGVLVDEVVTNCWDELGGELFHGEGTVDENGDWDVLLDGDEADCVFGPAEDYPGDGDFAILPAAGMWDELDDGMTEPVEECDVAVDPFADACPPMCWEDETDPDCIPFCEDEPFADPCIWYCDWFDDPQFCV